MKMKKMLAILAALSVLGTTGLTVGAEDTATTTEPATEAITTTETEAETTAAETTAETNAATTEKHINIRAYCNEAEAVLIEISNNGPAIPPDIAGHIFIPFFTTKENGSGIGLSISRQIMRLSGGSLSLIAGKETTFVLKFN